MDSTSVFEGLSALSLDDQVKISRFGRGPSLGVQFFTVHEAFENIVDELPSAIAARHGKRSLTYSELDACANWLAQRLLKLGLRPKQRVCLVVQRSFEMLVGIFAILKTGCQYVPIDGGVASDASLAHIFQDTGAEFVLCLPTFRDRVKRHAHKGITVIPIEPNLEKSWTLERPNIQSSYRDGAYAIYTSGTPLLPEDPINAYVLAGSTGKPKGVDVSHGNVVNALTLEPARLGISHGSKVAQVLNIAFDMAAWEILGCLMNGGTLYLRESQWEETLKQVDTLITTPSVLCRFRRNDYMNIKTVVTGGEPCPQSLADEWADNATYYNICGPTEVTILNTAHKHQPGQTLSIGTPLPNTTVYILDENENPVPFKEQGIMWVGGAGVTRGYINLPELTASRFKEDRFCRYGTKMFNTGDLVRWRDDGSLETFGRIDDQVKIKGFRVELDGVSAVIEQFPGITRACVRLVDGELHGFYTTLTFIDEEDLLAFVEEHLPYYSRPTRWTYVASIPLTPNGKVDKQRLAALSIKRARTTPPKKTYTSKELYHPAALKKSSSTVKSEITLCTSNVSEKPTELPEKNGFKGARWLRHRIFILYRRLFTLVMIANLAAAGVILYRRVKRSKPMMADIASASATNLTVSVLMRSEPVINFLFTVTCSVPTWVPLGIRRHCARIFHIGGLHSGCAIAAVLWFTIFTIGGTLDFTLPKYMRCVSTPSMVITYIINLILLAILAMSHPKIRERHHDAWELMHRFGGWTALIFFWAHAFMVTSDLREALSTPMHAYRSSPPIWLLTVTTAAIIFPWLFLRKVPVRSEFLSDHAVRLHFEYWTPVVGSSVRLAERPLRDWHGFATITNPNGKGFSLIVSNAGDFTKRTIQRCPSHIWVRGIPACGVLRIATLFKSVVLVATGSGIGPCLAVILAKRTPCRILWTASNPEKTFGKEIIQSVLEKDPHAIIHNTRTDGKPDMNRLTYQLYKESNAEAVCVISNKRFTTQIVYAMEARGIPAYGAIFDS